MKQKTIRTALVLLTIVFVCIAMNAAAFLIDTPAMRENAAKSLEMYKWEGASPELAGGYKSAQLDNFTAALIVKTAAYTGPQTLLEKTLGGYRTEMPMQEDSDGWAAFCTYADGSEAPDGGLSYSRYWHGYTLPVRILLCFFSASGIQMLLYYVQTVLAMLVFALCLKRCPAILPGLVTAFFLLMPAATGLCLQYAPVTLIALVGCLAILMPGHPIDRFIGMPAFFALLGLITNYFDLLTFPLVALGFPLAVRMAMQMTNGTVSFKKLFFEMLFCGLAFGAGYAGMWTLKWMLTGLCFGMDRLLGIFSQAALRVSAESGGQTYERAAAIMRNLDVLADKPAYLAIELAAFGASAAFPVCRTVSALRDRRPFRVEWRAWLYLLLFLVPIAWYIVMANHSIDHTYFTYRNITVAFLAQCAYIAHIIAPVTEDNP